MSTLEKKDDIDSDHGNIIVDHKYDTDDENDYYVDENGSIWWRGYLVFEYPRVVEIVEIDLTSEPKQDKTETDKKVNCVPDESPNQS